MQVAGVLAQAPMRTAKAMPVVLEAAGAAGLHTAIPPMKQHLLQARLAPAV
jgi:hypothetical protein